MDRDDSEPAMTPADPGGTEEPITDRLPADLDISEVTGPYVFPNTNRRRVAALGYLAVAAACIVAAAVASDSSRVNNGLWVAGVALAVLGVHSIVTAWNTRVDESEALEAAARSFDFPVGHASAQLSWRGWSSRPTWRILAFSAEDQPTSRGLATVDAVDGRVLEHFTEANDEDWSALV